MSVNDPDFGKQTIADHGDYWIKELHSYDWAEQLRKVGLVNTATRLENALSFLIRQTRNMRRLKFIEFVDGSYDHHVQRKHDYIKLKSGEVIAVVENHIIVYDSVEDEKSGNYKTIIELNKNETN